MEEALEGFHLGQAIEQLDGIDRIGGRAEPALLGSLSQPLALFGHEHVRVVVAGRREIDAAECLDRFVRRGHAVERTGDEIGGKAPQVLVGDTVCPGEEGRVANRRPRAERVEFRCEMAVAADRLSQVDRANDLFERHPVRNGMNIVTCRRRPALEQRARVGIDGSGIAAVLFVQLENVATIEPCKLLPARHDPGNFNLFLVSSWFVVLRSGFRF